MSQSCKIVIIYVFFLTQLILSGGNDALSGDQESETEAVSTANFSLVLPDDAAMNTSKSTKKYWFKGLKSRSGSKVLNKKVKECLKVNSDDESKDDCVKRFVWSLNGTYETNNTMKPPDEVYADFTYFDDYPDKEINVNSGSGSRYNASLVPNILSLVIVSISLIIIITNLDVHQKY